MAYRDSSLNFIGYLDIESNKAHLDIFDIIVNQLNTRRLRKRYNLFSAEAEGKIITGIQLFLSVDDYKFLHMKFEDLGINFESILKRDWGHIHPYCYINDEYFECIAEGTEDGWQLYYDDDEKGLVAEDRLYIGFVSNSDIDKLRDINKVFEKWLKDYMGKH